MAIKKPLVLTGGELEQLQPGDSLAPSPNSLQLQCWETGGVTIGAPASLMGADAFGKAAATDRPHVIGLAAEAIAENASGAIQTNGKLSATTAEWDAITGGTDGLVATTTYYLSDSDYGKLVDTPPTTAGNYVVRVGVAVNATDLQLMLSRPIKL